MQHELATQENEISVEQGLKVLEILEATNLNWSVRKEDLMSSSGLITPNSGIYRNDTNEWLGTTSKKYIPYQNVQIKAVDTFLVNHRPECRHYDFLHF